MSKTLEDFGITPKRATGEELMEGHRSWGTLTGAQQDTLRALVLRGPLADGDVPSKAGRNDLLDMGLAVQVAHNQEDGYQTATYAGLEVWKGRDVDSPGVDSSPLA